MPLPSPRPPGNVSWGGEGVPAGRAGAGGGGPRREEGKEGEACGRRGEGGGAGVQGLGVPGRAWGQGWGNPGAGIAPLNMKLVPCKYDANRMQTSAGFPRVQSSGSCCWD